MPPGLGYINPAIILRAMQQRGLMPKGPAAAQFQNGPPPVGPGGMQMIAPQDVTSALPQIGMPPQQQGRGGVMGFLDKPGIRDALMATGTALLAQKDRAGSLGGALGQALPAGMQAFQQGKQGAALDEAFADADPGMRRLLVGLSPGTREGVAANLLMQRLQLQAPTKFEDTTDAQGRPVSFNPMTGEFGQPFGEGRAESVPAVMSELKEWRAAHPDMAPSEQLTSFYETRRGAGTTINVGQESPTDRALTEIEAGDVQAAVTAARVARQQLGALAEVERLLDEGVPTGAAEDRMLPVRQIAAAFGVGNVDQLIQQENFQALSNQIAIGMTQQLSGQISERELDFVRATVPSLGTTTEANRRMVDIARRANQTAIDVAEAKREYFRENGSLAGFEPIRRRLVEEQLLDHLPEPDTNVNPDARMRELQGQGKTVDEIIEIGRREGWIG